MLVDVYRRSATGSGVGTGGGGQQPVIQTSATTIQTTPATSHAITMPSSIAVGDLLLVFFCIDGATTPTTPSGWTQEASQASVGNENRLLVYRKIAAGSDTMTVSTSSTRSAAAALRISPATTVYSATAQQSSSNSPDPPSLSPGVGAVSFLWLAAFASMGDGLTTAAPSGFGSGISNTTAVGADGASIAVYSKSESVDTMNPGTATATGSRPWALATIAIRD